MKSFIFFTSLWVAPFCGILKRKGGVLYGSLR
nr:MAG TPA: Ribonucleotide reductase inhibitor [Caudoviricetes sp.]